MLITKSIEMKWNRKNKDWYKEKGYKFTEYADKFYVNPLDLSVGSHKEVEVECDYCQKPLKMKFKDFNKQRNKTSFIEDVCNDCGYLKSRKNNTLKYGVDNPMQRQEVVEAFKSNLQEKYGVDNISQIEGIQDKVKTTNLERYGVHSYFQTEEFQEKTKKTNLERYGVEHNMQCPEIKEKALKTLYEKGNGACSQQQRHICELTNGLLNYPVSRSMLDMVFLEDKIYLEYDGGGHDLSVKLGFTTQKEFDKKEKNRTFFLLDKGWKEIRIISSDDKLPSDKEIVNFVNKAKEFLKTKGFSVRWDLNSNLVSTSYKRKYDIKDFMNNNLEKEAV